MANAASSKPPPEESDDHQQINRIASLLRSPTSVPLNIKIECMFRTTKLCLHTQKHWQANQLAFASRGVADALLALASPRKSLPLSTQPQDLALVVKLEARMPSLLPEFELFDDESEDFELLASQDASVVEARKTELVCRRFAFMTLSQMCAWNPANSLLVGTHPRFVALTKSVIPALTPDRIEISVAAMNTVYNILNNSFATHPHLLTLLPNLLPLLSRSPDRSGEVASWACNLLYNFALCEQSRPALKLAQVPKQMVEVLSNISDNTDGPIPELRGWVPVVVVMALANMLAPPAATQTTPITTSSTEEIDKFGGANEQDVISIFSSAEYLSSVCLCLWASIHRQEYPSGSEVYFEPWEVSMAISNLSLHTTSAHKTLLSNRLTKIVNLNLLLNNNDNEDKSRTKLKDVYGLLCDALSMDEHDWFIPNRIEKASEEKRIQYSLLALWRLTEGAEKFC